MLVVQAWTNLIATGEDEIKLKGLDFTMTLQSQWCMHMKNLLLVECVYSDPEKGVQYAGQFEDIIRVATENPENLFLTRAEGKESLSSLNQSFVRKWPAVTRDGREWNQPYKKRVNGTTRAISNAFINAFVDLVDRVLSEPHVKLIFQMAFGGGALRSKGKDNVDGVSVTSIPHRNMVWLFVFDLFYDDGYEKEAELFQSEMQNIIDDHFSHGQEIRFFWGSFADTDISKEEIRKMYYDNDKEYSDLQNLKKRIDPDDVFHTSLTVQVPK
jgi:hypothetical protein